jgi:acyl-CoA synthetase (AMP-forming)/AMP-acid ligase II
MTTENIAGLISGLAQKQPERTAVIDGGRTITFAALQADIDRLAAGFARRGIKPGMHVALLATPSIEFVSLTFALFKAGAVLVLVDPGIGLGPMKKCLGQAKPEAFVGIPKAHAARLLLGWAKETARIHVTVGRRWFWDGLTLEDVRRAGDGAPVPQTAPQRAAILFTSGSTGIPKGAVYTHAMFSAQAKMLRDYFDIQPGFNSVPTFPLFALFDVALGLTIVIPKMDFTKPAKADPAMLTGLINKYSAVQLFGSPALIDTLSRYGEKNNIKLPSLRRVISCGAPVSQKIINRILKMLAPGTLLHTPYGATEALPVACINSDELAALPKQHKGTCVGKTWPGMETFIIKITDSPIEKWSDDLLAKDGDIGEITVKGPVASREYFAIPQSTAHAKISGENGAFYHRMGDAGWKDGEGRLWFCGRKNQRVITDKETLFTIPCESVFNACPKVRRCALVGVGEKGRQTPVLCVETEGPQDETALRAELLALGAEQSHTKDIKTVLFHPGFPVDIRHNAKISREKLASWAEGKI